MELYRVLLVDDEEDIRVGISQKMKWNELGFSLVGEDVYKRQILDGKEVSFKSSKEALENGVAMVHQELNQALARSVMDNLWFGRYPLAAGIMAVSYTHLVFHLKGKLFGQTPLIRVKMLSFPAKA